MPIKLVNLTFDASGGWSDSHREFKKIKNWINDGKIVRIPSPFPANLIQEAKNEIAIIAESQAPENVDILESSNNFHRLDDSDKNSAIKVKRLLHRFFFLPWNYDSSSPINKIGKALIQLRKQILGNDPDTFFSNIQDGHYVHWTVAHYPVGGGNLIGHSDPIFPMPAEVSITLSQYGRNFRKGGLWVKPTSGEKIFLDNIMNEGDIHLFKQDLQHGIDPIDPEKKLSWDLEYGRISLFAPVRMAPWVKK